MAVRISSTDITGLLNEIKTQCKSMAASQPFNYSFLDEEFNKQCKEDQRRGEIFLLFSILAILIACLGIFGLAAYSAQQRAKEIGIRKDLGAAIKAAIANPVKRLKTE